MKTFCVYMQGPEAKARKFFSAALADINKHRSRPSDMTLSLVEDGGNPRMGRYEVTADNWLFGPSNDGEIVRDMLCVYRWHPEILGDLAP